MKIYPRYGDDKILSNIWFVHLDRISRSVLSNYFGEHIGINSNAENVTDQYNIECLSYITQYQRENIFGWSRTTNVKKYKEMVARGQLIQIMQRHGEVSHFCLNTVTIKDAIKYAVSWWMNRGVPHYHILDGAVKTITKPIIFDYMVLDLQRELKDNFRNPDFTIGIDGVSK